MNCEHVAYTTCASNGCGVLTANTFTPLTLVACSVEVEVHGNSARLNVRYEYNNYTGKDQRVIAAYPLPMWWDLMSCRADYAKDSVVGVHCVTTPLNVEVSDAAATSFPILPGPKPDGVVAIVAAQRLPWMIGLGSSVLIGATYAVPLNALCKAGEFRMVLPMELFPDAPPPPPSTMEYESLFTMKWPSKLPKGLTIDVKCKTFTPLAGTVELRPTVGNVCDPVPAQVEIVGDSGFRLHYEGPLAARVRGGFELFCPLFRTIEPLRFFVEVDNGREVCDDDRYALTLVLTPVVAEQLSATVNAELIFVVDSHSNYASACMSQALRVALYGAPDKAPVNIILITEENDICLCPGGSTQVNQLDIDGLAAFVAQTRPQRPSVGVSHLNRVMRSLVNSESTGPCGPVPRGFVRHIIVLSDEGTKSHAVEAISLAAHHQHNMRFSAVGLITAGGANAAALQLLAQEGGGVYYDATDAEELQAVLAQVVSLVAVPTVTDVELRFREPEVRVESKQLRAIPQGLQQFVQCFVPASLENFHVVVIGRIGSASVEYTGQGSLTEVFLTACSEPQNAFSVGMLHLSAAASRIRYLVEGRSSFTLNKSEVQEVGRYSETYMLPSPFTEMKQIRPSVGGGARSQTIPGAADTPIVAAARYVPRHWLYAQFLQRLSCRRLAEGLIDCRPQQLRQKIKQLEGATTNGDAPIVQQHSSAATLGKPRTTKEFIRHILMDIVDSVLATSLCVRRIAALQAPDGSFSLDSRLAVCVGLPCDRMKLDSLIVENNAGEEHCEAQDVCKDKERLWATSLVVVSIEKQPSGIVTLAYRKAMSFIENNDPKGGFINRAREVFAGV